MVDPLRRRASAAVVAAAAAVCLISFRAEAGADKAWAAARANLPKDTSVVVGLDLAQLTKSSLFSFAFPLLLSQQADVKDGLDLVKSACQLDPLASVQGVVIGTDDAQSHGAIYIAVEGLDQAKLVSCLEAVGKAKGKDAEVAVRTVGKVTELGVGDKTIYLTWIGTSVLVLPLEFTSKDDLQRWSGGKGGLARSRVSKGTRKVNTRAAMWAVSAVAKELDDKVKMKLGYGAVTLAAATIAADLHVQVGSPADARAAADKAQGELSQLAANPGLAANLRAVLTSVSVTSAGDEIAVKGAMPESDVLSLMAALMH